MERKSYLSLLLTVIFSISIAFADHHGKKDNKDIVDTAVAAGSFNTLVAAVKAAGLVETLKGDGPFTVFAPTDEAFAKLPAGTVESLLKPENKDKLVAILTYHVIAGSVKAADVVNLDQAKTVEGRLVKIRVEDGAVFINNATVVKTDIATSNGVIHVIDTVLLPEDGATPETSAIDLIEKAIQRGVPLYNHGQPAACAAVYEITIQALLDLHADLPQEAQMSLRKALFNMYHSTDNADRAWILRDGLDGAHAALMRSTMTRM